MQMETLYFGSVFIAGLLSFFSPCVIPLLPVYISTFMIGEKEVESNFDRRKRIILKSALFTLGLSTCFIILGFGAGIFGQMLNYPQFKIVLGIIVIILGIHQMGVIKIPVLFYEKKVHVKASNNKGKGYLSSYILGLTFSFGWTPCIGPILGSILGLSIGNGGVLYSLYLMLVYSLGFMIPFLIIAVFSDFLLIKLKMINKHLDKLKIMSGVIIIVMGILLMSGQLNRIASMFI